MDNIIVAIEIGGTYIRFYFGFHSPIVFKRKLIVKENVEEEIEYNICSVIDRKLKEYPNVKISSIGISMAGIFDRADGKIIYWSNNAKWGGFNLRDYMD